MTKRTFVLVTLMSLMLIACAAPSAQWQGNWDTYPQFWGGHQLLTEEIEWLSEEYTPLLLPRQVGEYVFIGGSEQWRGFQVTLESPNIQPVTIKADYWNGQWKSLVVYDRTGGLTNSGKIEGWYARQDWTKHTLVVSGEPVNAFWVRLAVSAEVDAVGWSQVIHDAPILVNDEWQLFYHRRTACENRPGYGKLYVTLRDKNGQPIRNATVSFDVEPSTGIAYDHPDIWGLTNEKGYLEWDHFGVPTQYHLSVNGEAVVVNIRTDLPNEYCGSGIGSWRPVNRPGIYSYDIELQQQ